MALHPNAEVDLRIDGMSYGGRGVGLVDGFAVFVTDAAPGDSLRARVLNVTTSFAEAEPVRVDVPSPARVVPRCPHFGICGGCLWQHLSYEAQLRAKEGIVADSLRDLSGPDGIEIRSILPAGEPWYYRNKMEFAFQPDGRLGLHLRDRWDEIVDVQTCFLQSPRTVELLHEVRGFIRAHRMTCYDRRTHTGFLRHLVVREGRATGEWLVAVVTAPGAFPQARDLTLAIVSRHPDLTGLVWAISPDAGDAVDARDIQVLYGRPFITERVRHLTFRLGLQTFFQTNPAQAERMMDIVCDFAALTGAEDVLDLYCGVGTFTLALAGRAAHVTGVEVVPAAVEAARDNAALNGIANATFQVGDVRRYAFLREPGAPPDLLVLDPPRAGAGRAVMRAMGRLAPRRVIYISCNPTTLTPDLRELIPYGYEVRVVQPIDLFPQTYHVECVVLLERRSA